MQNLEGFFKILLLQTKKVKTDFIERLEKIEVNLYKYFALGINMVWFFSATLFITQI